MRSGRGTGVAVEKPQTELESLLELLKPRARSLLDFATVFRAYFSDEFAFDPACGDEISFVRRDAKFTGGTFDALRRGLGVQRGLE